jgi:hypothetical protein
MEKLIGVTLYELVNENLGNVYFDEDTTEDAEAHDNDEHYWATFDDYHSPIITRNGWELDDDDIIEYFKKKSKTTDVVFCDFERGTSDKRESDGTYVQDLRFIVFSYPSNIEVPVTFDTDDMSEYIEYKKTLNFDCVAFENGKLSKGTIKLNLSAAYNPIEKIYHDVRLVNTILSVGDSEYTLTASLSKEGEFDISVAELALPRVFT